MTMNPSSRPPRIAVVTFSAGDGGNDKMLVHLAQGLSEQGCAVDFITRTMTAPYLDRLPMQVRRLVIHEASHRDRTRSLGRYVAENAPDVVLSGKRSDREVLEAVRLVKTNTRVFIRVGINLSARYDHRSKLIGWWHLRPLRRLLPQADGILAVSRGVAQDLLRLFKIPSEKIHVVPNPVVTPKMLSEMPPVPSHRFYASSPEVPVVVGMGGLRKAKDFPTLLKAFAIVVQTRPARLLILGRGHLRDKLMALARSLNIAPWTDFPGFVESPYSYLAHAQLFVLSSLWEGSPNVLIEALAMGTPVVATDCPSGPREILQDGRYGRLVPCGNPHAMAQAMLKSLENPPQPSFLKEAVTRYTFAASTHEYLRAFGLLAKVPAKRPCATQDSSGILERNP
ncbi:glycosyltransferase [Desulfosoma caldarium]|uniref:Glycosyltransferase involved in cell wall biosynthesis n=1 Tax=Desulfosoma caldarium TaxID=610254 RepID=A0A3N1VPW4_9BACT|nr:glycosyltransferase [Desulfosoma caldarium]ROR03091.1 glycosyltransferase involved in cell wall biosynthesis [Desulfosoma caldarium]